MSSTLLEIEDLCMEVADGDGWRPLLRGVNLSIGVGEVASVVGESGSGKSITARAVLGMFPTGARKSGSIRFAGFSILDAEGDQLRSYRAHKVAMIFQDPRAHVNPVRRIGDYLTEAARSIGGMARGVARDRAVELLDAVRIEEPKRIMDRYPHELSGGMLQRVMIAGALMGEPQMLLADEPTTALDVTTQAEVMAILARLRKEFDLAMMFITHDLELAAATADRTAVMYAGRIVEQQPSALLHAHPRHPYTVGLLRSRPSLESAPRRLVAIEGVPAAASEAGDGCSFAPRCEFAEDRCWVEDPQLVRHEQQEVACLRADEPLRTDLGSRG